MRAIFLIGTLFACNGNKIDESNFTQLYPKMVVSAESVDMEVVVLYTGQEEFQIINAGLAELKITDISITNNDDGVYQISPVIEDGLLEVEPSEPLTVLVNFEPGTYRQYDREIVISSDDLESPEFRLPLNGEGIDGPVPDIEVMPRALEFGTVLQNESELLYFVLTNRGTGDLIVDSIVLSGSSAFQLQADISGVSYGLEQSANIVVSYSPTEEGGDNATLTVTSNDPDEGTQTVVLLGNGGGDYEHPIASFNCPGDIDPPKTIYLSGSNSYDPGGQEPLSYQWTLNDKPSGSSTSIEEPTLEQTPFFVDVAGDYSIGLVVANTLGVESEPVICEFEAIPDKAVHVELSWDTSNSDLDLHMVLEGYDYYSYAGDCCWCNPNPSWGETGNEDDPNLSLDNRLGYGPEAIHITSPYDGDYNIMVNYFSNGGGGDSTATVRVYLDGILIAEEARLLSRRDLWNVGYVNWSNGVGSFIVENETPVTATVFGCQQ